MNKKIIIAILFPITFFALLAFILNLHRLNVYKKNHLNNLTTIKTLSIELNKEKLYLAVGETFNLVATIKTYSGDEIEIKWTSSNSEIASITDGLVKGIAPGSATITVTTLDNITKNIEIIVSDLVTLPIVNSAKPYLSCGRYSEEEANLLDEILLNRIQEAGYGTRSGPVAAARFLLLEFPYTIKYFNENGRLNNHSGQSHVDGEGRYYHQGLYLHKNKFSSITASKQGPAIWGCNLWDEFVSRYAPNGLTCSGFVSWTLLNGGFDVGDSGAGDTSRTDDIGDLGERIKITKELMQSGKVKVGDIIGRDGHVAIIIGLDETNIYIAESLPSTVRVVTLTKYDGLIKSTNFSYIILMDDIYKNDGNYTEMW